MDDFENEVSRALRDQVAGMPESYDAAPELVARARRRRAAKLSALAIAVVVVAGGTAGAVAQVINRDPAKRVISTAPPSTTTSTSTTPTPTTPAAPRIVLTVACPITDSLNRLWSAPPTTPRAPAAGDPALFAHFHSFASVASPRYTVLGPKGWSCDAGMGTDGDNAMVVYPAGAAKTVPDLSAAPIAIENDYLWHGGVGSVAACRATGDPAAVQYVTQYFPEQLPCLSSGRRVTRVDAHLSKFVDANGVRGAAWIAPPTSVGADDGQLSVLTCRPTLGLTADDCDTIVADFAARNSAERVAPTPEPSTTISSTTTSTTQPADAASGIAAPPFSPSSWAATAGGAAISNYGGGGPIATYDAAGGAWRTLPNRPPFAGQLGILGARGNDVYVAGLSNTETTTTTAFARVDADTEKWTKLAAIPDGIYGAITTAGDANHLFVYSGINNQVAVKNGREIALQYDIAADRWTKLPRSPLHFRAGVALQWTGTELLVWGGGDYENGGPAFAQGAAYNPATRKWRVLPAAPIAAVGGAASVWTGSQMVVWGGSPCIMCGNSEVATGASYDPATNSWTAIPTSPLEATDIPAAVWTGREMVVLSRATGGNIHPAAAYDPATKQWRMLPPAPVSARTILLDDVSAYAAWVANRAVFGMVSPGGGFAGIEYTLK